MNVSLNDLYPVMREVLDSGGEFSFITRGRSMMPMLRDGVDTIVLTKVITKPKKYDVLLYRRNDGRFVLHRIVGENKDGYIASGDNQTEYEYGIKPEQIEAKAVAYIKNGVRFETGTFRDKLYVRKIVLRRFMRRIKKKLFSR